MLFRSLLRRLRRDEQPPAKPFGPLMPGWRYRVTQSFVDYDGIMHPVGEHWTFLRSSFLPYEDGLSLFTASEDGAAGHIRLQMRPDAQGTIAAFLDNYFLPVASRPARHALLLTRDSLCLADDIEAPHAAPLEVCANADAAEVARAVLDAKYLAWTDIATWSLALGDDVVVFGWRWLRRFIKPVGPDPLTTRASAIDRLYIRYHAQTHPDEIAATLRHWTGQPSV